MQAEIKKFLHEEKALGEILAARVNRYGVRASIGKRATPLPIPPEVDYDLWLGPAQDQPIYRDKLQYDWHWDWNTGSGEMGNWGVHVLDDMPQQRVPGQGLAAETDSRRRRPGRLGRCGRDAQRALRLFRHRHDSRRDRADQHDGRSRESRAVPTHPGPGQRLHRLL